MVVGGILAALRETGARLTEQRVVSLGAGAAGIGIARLLRAAAADEGGELEALAMLDSHGLLHTGRDDLEADKLPFALAATQMEKLGLQAAAAVDLESVVRQVRPTILIGTSGQAGAFGEAAIRALAATATTPIVLPLSNPTSQCEATPADVLAWTEGRALVATGSPFDAVEIGGDTRVVGQANNMFVFPGIGLGAIVAEAREVTDRMFLVAARTLAAQVSRERVQTGAIYPALADLRSVSLEIAVAVAAEARDAGVGRQLPDEALRTAVVEAMWEPSYSADAQHGAALDLARA